MSIDVKFERLLARLIAKNNFGELSVHRAAEFIQAYEAAKTGQPDELQRSLEDRVVRIEKWIDFWETIETGWSARATMQESSKETKEIKCTCHNARRTLQNNCPVHSCK